MAPELRLITGNFQPRTNSNRVLFENAPSVRLCRMPVQVLLPPSSGGIRNPFDNPRKLIGNRIRAIREAKGLSRGDIEKRCGLFRVYISRAENGHLVPSVENLEKLARALEVSLYQLFYEGKKRPLRPRLPKRKRAAKIAWGTTRKEIYFWNKLRGLLARMREPDRRLLFHMARKVARR